MVFGIFPERQRSRAPDTYKNRQKPVNSSVFPQKYTKTCGNQPFRLDFARLQAALF
jgi:hypothetical protein